MTSLHRTALALVALGALVIPVTGCGSDSSSSAATAPVTATTATPSLSAATAALGAAALDALQVLKGGVSAGNADAFAGLIATSQAKFNAAVAQVKAATANGAAAQAIKTSVLKLSAAASADYAAVVAAGTSDIAALKAAATRLQEDLGSILASPAA
jgi:hypothetical protein